MGPSGRGIFRCPVVSRRPLPGQDVKAASSSFWPHDHSFLSIPWARGHLNLLAHVLHGTPPPTPNYHCARPCPSLTREHCPASLGLCGRTLRMSGLPQVGSSLGFYLAHSNPVALNYNFSCLPPSLGGLLTMSGDICVVTTSRGAGRSPGLMGRT